MQESTTKSNLLHNIIMENRKRLNVSGVVSVDNFDDTTVIVTTNMGEMTIKGEKLHIDRMDIDSGNMNVDGKIFAIVYNDNISNGSFFSKIFK